MYSFSLEARRSHVLLVPVFMLLTPRVLWLPVPLSILHVFIATIARRTDARLAVFFILRSSFRAATAAAPEARLLRLSGRGGRALYRSSKVPETGILERKPVGALQAVPRGYKDRFSSELHSWAFAVTPHSALPPF